MSIDDWNLHSILGWYQPNQGATQAIPEPMVLCYTCGYMTASEYHYHLYELIQ